MKRVPAAGSSLFDDSDFADHRFGVSLGLIGRSDGQPRFCAQTLSGLQVLCDSRNVKSSELRRPGCFCATFVIMGVEKVERAHVMRITFARLWRCARRQIEVDVIENTWLHVRAQIPGDDIKTTPGFELLNTLAERKLFCLRSRRRFEVHLHRRAAEFDGT